MAPPHGLRQALFTERLPSKRGPLHSSGAPDSVFAAFEPELMTTKDAS